MTYREPAFDHRRNAARPTRAESLHPQARWTPASTQGQPVSLTTAPRRAQERLKATTTTTLAEAEAAVTELHAETTSNAQPSETQQAPDYLVNLLNVSDWKAQITTRDVHPDTRSASSTPTVNDVKLKSSGDDDMERDTSLQEATCPLEQATTFEEMENVVAASRKRMRTKSSDLEILDRDPHSPHVRFARTANRRLLPKFDVRVNTLSMSHTTLACLFRWQIGSRPRFTSFQRTTPREALDVWQPAHAAEINEGDANRLTALARESHFYTVPSLSRGRAEGHSAQHPNPRRAALALDTVPCLLPPRGGPLPWPL